MELLIEFLNEFTVLIVVGICLCVGYVLKNIITTDQINKFIPLIMALLGLALNIWINLAFTPEVVLGGFVSGLASTGLYEAFHQFIKKK